MMEAEFVMCHLRNQVRDLQSMLNYLESRPVVEHEDYSYVHTRLHEVIGRLKEMERFSSQRGGVQGLRAHWLN